MAHKVVITGLSTSDLPKYTTKEIEEMLRRIKNGENYLRDKFIEGNMRLVLSMVQRFRTDKVSADDLFQVGILGLIKALDNFNINLNVKFSTYAVPMILGEIKRYIRESTALKVGRGIRDIAYRAMSARERLESKSTNEVCLEEIAAEICVPYSEVGHTSLRIFCFCCRLRSYRQFSFRSLSTITAFMRYGPGFLRWIPVRNFWNICMRGVSCASTTGSARCTACLRS